MNEISSRERVIKALNHEEADRVPIDVGGAVCALTEGAYMDLAKHLGMDVEIDIYDYYQRLPWIDEKILDMLHADTRYFVSGAGSNYEFKIELDGSFMDEWGCKHTRVGNYGDVAADGHALANLSISDLDHYPFPDPEDPARFKGLRDKVKKMYDDTDYALMPINMGSIYWMGTELVGLERYSEYIITNQKFIIKLADILLDWYKKYFNKLLDEVGEYIEMVWLFGDDWGIQTGPVINPEQYRKIYKGRSKELVDFVKARSDAKICIHVCGSVYWAMEDFIEIGVEVVNPVQVSAKDMETDRLKKEFGDRIVFWGGGCDPQHVLPFGSEEDVRKEVKKRIHDLGPGGGFVFAAVHNIQKGVPPQNILTMLNAAAEYGKYPINV
jgi:uroporphyrinogen decarboxylase